MLAMSSGRVTGLTLEAGAGWCCDHDLGTTEDTGAGLSACCLVSTRPPPLPASLSVSLCSLSAWLGSIRGVGTGHQSSVSQSCESDSWPTSVTIIILCSPHATITSI